MGLLPQAGTYGLVSGGAHMRIALALVILGGLLYLEAVRNWTLHRTDQFLVALRELGYSTQRLAESVHAWGNAIDLTTRK